jgi:hypothetical protein
MSLALLNLLLEDSGHLFYLDWDRLLCLLEDGLDHGGVLIFRWQEEGVGHPFLARPSCAANTMDIVLHVVRAIVIDDTDDVRDI